MLPIILSVDASLYRLRPIMEHKLLDDSVKQIVYALRTREFSPEEGFNLQPVD